MGDISKNYSYVEFSRSGTAAKKGWDNSIPEQYKSNIQRLCVSTLQPINDATGWINIISSGYRSKQLNKEVGGVDSSHHLIGCAADCNFYKVTNGKRERVDCETVMKKVDELGVPYTEMIPYSKQGFVHIAYTGVAKHQKKMEDSSDGADVQVEYPVNEVIGQYCLHTTQKKDGADEQGNITIEKLNEALKKLGFTFGDDGKPNEDWLEFTDGNQTNLERIVEMFSPTEKIKYKDGIENGKVPYVKVGTRLLVKSVDLEAQRVKFENSDVFAVPDKTAVMYWTDNIKKITSDPLYQSVWKNPLGNVVVQQKNLNAKIWVWSRAFGRFVDISPYVLSISTSKSGFNGSFSIQVNSVKIAKNVAGFNYNEVNRFNADVELKGNDNDSDADKALGYSRTLDWFSVFMQQNDMVWLRFEELQMEEKYQIDGNDSLVKTNTDLTDSLIWDMIGFVDNVTSSINYDANSYAVSIEGRDFSKLFEDDGISFIPFNSIFGSAHNMMLMANDESPWLRRNGDGMIAFGMYFQSIKSSLGFIFEKCSQIEMVSSDFFQACDRYLNSGGEETFDPKGVWRLFKIWCDSQLDNRIFYNNALVNPDGSMADFIRSTCKEPFVEVLGDTWGAGYDLIIRKPPFDKSSIQTMYYAKNSQGASAESYIDIVDEDLFSFNLAFDNRVYSWYKIVPADGLIPGLDANTVSIIIPVFYLDAYVKVFGNKRCIVQDPYVLSAYLGGNKSEKKTNSLFTTLAADYIYAIESTAYLPFTRKGTITINGDRRIKVGTFVRLAATNEIFYVIGVQQSISFGESSLERQTVLTVERGMVVDYITNEKYNYFNIVNIDGLKDALQKALSSGVANTEFNTTLTREGDVFNFFLGRRQFVKNVWSASISTGELFEGEGNLAAFDSNKIVSRKEI